MRKSLLILSFVGLIGSSVDARTLTPAEALARALDNGKTSAPHRAPLRKSPILTVGEQNSPSLYVFDQGSEGYLVVSADDVAAPVLGYSTTGSIDPDNMPDNLRWWLNKYKAEIEYAAQNEAGTYTVNVRPTRSEITPIIKTQWNQTGPYNKFCPVDPLIRPDTICVTGCVATAMAQVMKSHNWPESFNADFNYIWNRNGSNLSWKESNVTFDWATMLENYNEEYNKTQADAVALLMKACGYSVAMQYTYNQSSANSYVISNALVNTFGFDKGVHTALRSLYDLNEWETLIYDNLNTCGAAIYFGKNDSNGHCFICDGYKDGGFFHFNWGWGGMSDGYYLLTALSPELQGIGGSAAGYNIEDGVVLGIKKPGESYIETCPIVCDGWFETTVNSVNALTLNGTFLNIGNNEVKGQIGVRFVKEDGSTVKEIWGSNISCPISSYYKSIPINGVIPEGKHMVYPIVRTGSKTYIIRCRANQVGYTIITKSGNKITSTEPAVGKYNISDVRFDTPLYQNHPFIVVGNASWSGDNSVSTPITGVFMTGTSIKDIIAHGVEIPYEFMPEEESFTVEYLSESIYSWDSNENNERRVNLPLGKYYFAMAIRDNLSPYRYRLISTPIEVESLSDPGATEVSLESWSILDSQNVNPNNLEITLNVLCKKGFFFSHFRIAVFGMDGKQAALFNTNTVAIEAGQTKTLIAKGIIPDAEAGEIYKVGVYSSTNPHPIADQFITISNQTGISDVITDTANNIKASPNPAHDYTIITAKTEINRIDIVSLSGTIIPMQIEIDGVNARIDVSDLVPGLYIARVMAADGVESVKIIKKESCLY